MPPKSRTIFVIGTVAFVAVAIFAGLGMLIYKIHARTMQERALADLKRDNPVEYYILYTPLKMTEDDLRHGLVGKWQLAGAKSMITGDFVQLVSPENYLKIFTLTNWSIVTYDGSTNVVYSASGRYELHGDNYTETIEHATGMMKQYLGRHPKFRIRLDGDNYYQMGAGKDPAIEEMWQRVSD